MKKLTNYTNKKFLLGFMAVAVMVLTFGGVLAANPSSASAQIARVPYVHVTTLRVGSSGTAVANLQASLNYVNQGIPMLVVDGKFGPKTFAAVRTFQISKSLVADGIVGPITGQALITATLVIVPPFVPIVTLCPNGNTLASNCTVSPTGTPTGPTCPNGNLISNNCAPTGTPSGPLTGGAGDALITETSVDVDSEIIEGENNIKVHAFRVEAEDSDIRVNSLRVDFVNSDTASSSRFDRYADEVSVWMGSTKVGSSSVDDFTRSGTSNSRTISLSNAIVREGSANRATFYIAVSALSTIDSGDHDSDAWTVSVDNIRFVDAQGAVITDGYDESSSFDFTDLAGSGDVKVRISSGDGNPTARNVEVSDTGTTSDVLLLEFRVKAEGSAMTFDQVDLDVTGTGATPAEIASQLTLKSSSGTVLGDLTSLGTNGTKTIDLFDEFEISKGSTATFRVFAKVNEIGVGNFGQGDSLKVDFQDFSDSIESDNGDAVSTIVGSAVGETQTFISEGAIVEFMSDSYTAYDATNSIDGTISLTFKVTALGNSDVTIAEDQGAETAGAGNNLIDYTIDGAVGTDAFVTCSNTTLSGGIYTISAGSNRTCTLAAKFNTVTGFVRLHIIDVDGTAVANVSTRAF